MKNQLGLFPDMARAEELRDNAIAKVSGNNEDWMTMALSLMRRHPVNIEVTGEEIRIWLIKNGLDAPKHHNAWGAFINSAVNAGMLVATGKVRKMKLPKSHARQTLVWRVI